MIAIVYAADALLYLDDLILFLLKEAYFSFEDTSIDYVRDIKYFINTKIATAPKKKAPPHFNKISKHLQYISYKRNNHTTWFISFLQKDNRYFIEYITNNQCCCSVYEKIMWVGLN